MRRQTMGDMSNEQAAEAIIGILEGEELRQWHEKRDFLPKERVALEMAISVLNGGAPYTIRTARQIMDEVEEADNG
jgi:hypothetical protein